MSQTFERYFGVSRAELVGRGLRQLLASRLGRALAEPEAVTAVLTARGDDETRSFDCRVLAEGGRPERWLESWSQPIRSGRHAGGRIDYYYDVTERKQAEEAARKSEDLLIQAQKMEAVGRLAGVLAHDFNNLLTAINGYTDLIVGMADDDRLKKYVGEIKKAGNRASDLTAKLLTLSRPPPSMRRVADLNQLVPNLEILLGRLIGEDVVLETRLSVEPGRVRIDPAQLEQVLLNLAVNARDAMPTGGRLLVESTGVDPGAADPLGLGIERHVCLRVSDTGVGIEDDVREHIFEPFFTTKTEGKGTGLGLSTVYATVTQNRGRITVDSTPGSGTTFSIYLPMADEQLDQP